MTGQYQAPAALPTVKVSGTRQIGRCVALRTSLGRCGEEKTILPMLYAFFWVILSGLNFICRRFGTLCSIFIGRWFFTHLPAYEDGTECSETSTYKIQTPGNYPEESTQHSEHGENLKSRISCPCQSLKCGFFSPYRIPYPGSIFRAM